VCRCRRRRFQEIAARALLAWRLCRCDTGDGHTARRKLSGSRSDILSVLFLLVAFNRFVGSAFNWALDKHQPVF
jgi:hypothetical protein